MLIKKLSQSVLIASATLVATLGAQANECVHRTVEEIAFGHTYQMTYVEMVPKVADQFFKMDDVFGTENETLLGFMTNGHAFLQVGPNRYDGEISAAGQVKVGRTSFQESIIIRFTDLPTETVEKLKEAIRAKQDKVPWSINCVQGACNFLEKEAGIKLDGWTHLVPLPTFFIRDMVKYGFVDKLGQKLGIEFFATNGQNFEALYSVLRGREIEIGQTIAGSTAQSALAPVQKYPKMILAGFGLTGVVLYFFWPTDAEENTK